MTWMPTVSGRCVDLLEPDPASIDFTVDVPDHLAKINRFAGATHAGPYSVAQHCVHGADALKRETGRSDLAFAFLLHDAHEYLLTDRPSPATVALLARAGGMAGHVVQALQLLVEPIDRAIHEAAGVAWPLPSDVRSAVKLMDLRMLRTERDHLLRPPGRIWAAEVEAVEPVKFQFGGLKPWVWPKAAEEWRQRFELFRPKPASSSRPLNQLGARS